MTLGVTRKDLVMVAVLLVGVLLAVLNQTFLSPALPTIMVDVGVDATTVQWLTSGYALVEAVVIPLSAYLIGRFSTRQLFITAFALFTVGSLSAALAPNFWVLLLGRVLQATCTGMSKSGTSFVPLNIRCSKRWANPVRSGASLRAPTP